MFRDALNDMSPMTKAFVIGMFLGTAFGVFYSICEVYGGDVGKPVST